MARNQYAKDYRLLETVDQRGRIHTDYEYIGDYYRFLQPREMVRRELLTRLALCAGGWLSWLGAMLPNSQSMRTWFVSLPFVFTAIPLWLMSSTVLELLRAKEPLEHRFADKLENRYPPAAMAGAVLPGVAAVLAVIHGITGSGFAAGEGVFSLCAVMTAFCCGVCFARRGRLTTDQVQP